MTEQASTPRGTRLNGIPGWVAGGAIVVAVLAVTALVWVLFQNTVGPGEVVRGLYDAAAEGDCDTSWDTLSPSLRESMDRDAFCASVTQISAPQESVRVDKVTLLGEEGEATRAEVTIDEAGTLVVWEVERDADDWYVVSLPRDGIFADA